MKRTLKIFLTLTAAWFFGAAAYATDNAPPAAHPPVPDAKAILQKMAQQLAQAPGFSVTMKLHAVMATKTIYYLMVRHSLLTNLVIMCTRSLKSLAQWIT